MSGKTDVIKGRIKEAAGALTGPVNDGVPVSTRRVTSTPKRERASITSHAWTGSAFPLASTGSRDR